MALCFVLVAFFLVTSNAVEVRRDAQWPPPMLKSFVKSMHDSCVASTGVAEAAIVSFSDGELFENDEKLKCYMSCLFQEIGITDDKGYLHLEKLVKTVDLLDDDAQDIFYNTAKRCLRPVITTPCESAFWFNKCWKNSDPVHYFLL